MNKTCLVCGAPLESWQDYACSKQDCIHVFQQCLLYSRAGGEVCTCARCTAYRKGVRRGQ